jgi:hypothetical protein
LRFILEPEQVIQQGAPVAKAILEKYRTPMPSPGLFAEDVEAVVAYLPTSTPGGTGASCSLRSHPGNRGDRTLCAHDNRTAGGNRVAHCACHI